jgi:Domain of unknown function (DUF4375)
MAEVVDYWTLVGPVWLPLNRSWDDGPDEFVRLFRSIRPEIGHLYAGHWCQSEVCNGGLHQFFSNTTGLLAPEAVDGFRAIGASVWADILAEAMEMFGSPYPRVREVRERFLPIHQPRPHEEWDPLSRFDDRFYDWDDWERVANVYAEHMIAKGRG